ncbi:MAG: DNA-binding transcriptional ArsR family regulator [Verrucomicrobiales bacterium]|jgi:DNA-binding transcriptional ArsR family regulator
MTRIRYAVLILAAAVLAGCSDPSTNPNMRPEEREVGYRGPARTNPFLAAERFLTSMGAETNQHFDLTDMPDYDVPIIIPSESLRSRQTARNLVNWVSEGGHIIYLLDGADTLSDDWLDSWAERRLEQIEEEKEDAKKPGPIDTSGEERAFENDEHPLLELLEVEVTDRDEASTEVDFYGEVIEVFIPGSQGVNVDDERTEDYDTIQSGSEDASSFLSFYHEYGRVTVIAHAHPWRNRYIGEGDHAQFLWDIVSLEGDPSAIWLVRGTRMSFSMLLWRYGWMPLISLAVLILFWLWRIMPRFGPQIAETEPVSREFTSHLSMTGHFLWKRKAARALVEPLRRRILKRFRMKSMLDDSKVLDEATAELAEASGLSPNRVRAALDTAKPREPNQITAILRDLQKLDTVK